jgi:hypothetical protein
MTSCTCPDPWCIEHARCGACGGEAIVTPDDPAFCPSCGHDVMPARACRVVNPPCTCPRLSEVDDYCPQHGLGR